MYFCVNIDSWTKRKLYGRQELEADRCFHVNHKPLHIYLLMPESLKFQGWRQYCSGKSALVAISRISLCYLPLISSLLHVTPLADLIDLCNYDTLSDILKCKNYIVGQRNLVLFFSAVINLAADITLKIVCLQRGEIGGNKSVFCNFLNVRNAVSYGVKH